MTKRAIGVVFCSLLAGPMAAQQYAVNASAPVVGSVATVLGGASSSTSIPIGPVAPGTIAAIGGLQVAASTAWHPTVPNQLAPLAFTVRAGAFTTSTSLGAFGSASMTLDLHLDNGGVGPLTGVLRLRKALTLLTGNASATVDVGADGSVEMSASSNLASIAVDAPGGSIDVRIVAQAAAGSLFGPTDPQIGDVSVHAEFFPGHTVVDRYDSFATLVSLDAAPVGSDRWQLGTAAPPTLGLQPFATVFGLQPTSVPIANGLTQLVTLDAWLPGTSLVFDLPTLPPGFVLYAQGLVIAPDGTLLSSNSVRALWF